MTNMSLMLLLLAMMLPSLCFADSVLWPKAHPDAPYAAIKFYEKTCDCPRGLNSTASLGLCFNSTNNEFTEVPCEDTPFWGVVFTWWIGAGLLMGAASTTGWGVLREFLLSFSILVLKRKAPSEHQVGDEDEMLKNQ
mmetsp:Transcript_24676/g.41717  ORF Transcript_24676/g.41717 Transcript_24676/m.41717 type:complete len:137 (-) Transcript_24676:231-641(-)